MNPRAPPSCYRADGERGEHRARSRRRNGCDPRHALVHGIAAASHDHSAIIGDTKSSLQGPPRQIDAVTLEKLLQVEHAGLRCPNKGGSSADVSVSRISSTAAANDDSSTE